MSKFPHFVMIEMALLHHLISVCEDKPLTNVIEVRDVELAIQYTESWLMRDLYLILKMLRQVHPFKSCMVQELKKTLPKGHFDGH